MGTVQTPFGAVEVSDVESAGRFSVGDKVAFTFDGTELGYATSAEGIVQRITKSGRSTRLTIDIGHGMTVLRHASDVEPVTGWQERVDPPLPQR